MINNLLEELVLSLKKLPGVGNKTAQRLAMYLINMNKQEALQISDTIRKAVSNFQNCTTCNMLTDKDPCQLCSDEKRSDELLCVVETTQDILLIEKIHEFQGKYFVLNRLLSPIDGIGPEEIHFPKLKKLIRSRKIKEIILAISPSTEGETTINYIASNIQNDNIKITRLSTGLPFGGDIEYSSSLTLSNAFRRRYSVKD